MTDSPQSKVGPNPVWFVATAKRRRTDLGHIKGQPTQFAHGHNRAGKREPNSVKQLPDGTTVLTLLQQDGIPVECFNELSNEDRRAKSCHFASDFGAVLPAFSGGTCPGASDERPSRTRVRRIENGKIILTPKVGVYFTVKADTFVPLKRGDFIICRERTLDATDERGSVHHTMVLECGVDTLTVHGIGLLQDSKDVKRAQREEKDEKAPSPKFNKKTKTYSCPPTWGVSSEDEVRCRKAR